MERLPDVPPAGRRGDLPAIGENTYVQTLFAFNVATGNIDPLLAKEVEFVDETTAVVTLHDGTAWQDGEP